jgi:glutamate N-acetyltransferase/amino-acid N-acetyltransferase
VSADDVSLAEALVAPPGFRAAGVAAGIKESGAKDVAVIVNDGPHPAAAAVFTTNRFDAAPVQWSRAALSHARDLGSTAKAVVLNSGGANACTGPEGFADVEATVAQMTAALHLEPEQVMVCSTGLIGERLPMPKLLDGIDAAVVQLSRDGWGDAANAILTTDNYAKTAQVSIPGEHGMSTIAGMAKGAGMLAPGLATMLVVLTTDAVLTDHLAQQALREAVHRTFHRIDSDGCMSTNDTVLLLASGASGNTPNIAEFTSSLTSVCGQLAFQLIHDAEGASHDIQIDVCGASSETAALEVARAVSRSNLFKAAIFGQDPNWGRVLSAVGTVPPEIAPFDPMKTDVSINGIEVCRAGGVGEPRELVDLSPRGVLVQIDLHAGDAALTLWTNDLTYDYVKENAEYSS